jgi:hypothetical protein
MTDPDPSPLFADGCTVIACYGNARPEDVHLASTIEVERVTALSIVLGHGSRGQVLQ